MHFDSSESILIPGVEYNGTSMYYGPCIAKLNANPTTPHGEMTWHKGADSKGDTKRDAVETIQMRWRRPEGSERHTTNTTDRHSQRTVTETGDRTTSRQTQLRFRSRTWQAHSRVAGYQSRRNSSAGDG